MGYPFSDITLYTKTNHKPGTPGYIEEVSLINFVSDFYVQKMHGYKPPKTSRITIHPAFHNIWKKPNKIGSIVSIAPYYNHDVFLSFKKEERYKYILELIQSATLELSEEYGWDKAIFENAYKEVIGNNFIFNIHYPQKLWRDKKTAANLSIEKTETVTSLYVNIKTAGVSIKAKLLDKENTWYYDCVYYLIRYSKWINANQFGICFNKGKLDIIYSIAENKVEYFENGSMISQIDFRKYFLFG